MARPHLAFQHSGNFEILGLSLYQRLKPCFLRTDPVGEPPRDPAPAGVGGGRPRGPLGEGPQLVVPHTRLPRVQVGAGERHR